MTFADLDRNQIREQTIQPRACRALWCAVIEDQFRLAVSPCRSDHKSQVCSAQNWFGSRDFFMVCALAGVDGAFVLFGVRRHLAMWGAA